METVDNESGDKSAANTEADARTVIRRIVANLLNLMTYNERNCGKSYLELLPMAVYGMVAKSLIG